MEFWKIILTNGKMSELLIRVTEHPALDVEKLMLVLADAKQHSVFGVREYPHNNPHWHFWLKADVKYDAVRKRLLKVPGMVGEFFSIKQGEGNPVYMCKGPLAVSKLKSSDYPGKKAPPEIVINTMGLTDEDIADHHEHWWVQAQGWLDKKKGTKNGGVGKGMIERCYDAMIDQGFRPNQLVPDRAAIIRWMVQDLVSVNKGVDVYSVRKWANAVMIKFSNEFFDELVNEIDAKF